MKIGSLITFVLLSSLLQASNGQRIMGKGHTAIAKAGRGQKESLLKGSRSSRGLKSVRGQRDQRRRKAKGVAKFLDKNPVLVAASATTFGGLTAVLGGAVGGIVGALIGSQLVTPLTAPPTAEPTAPPIPEPSSTPSSIPTSAQEPSSMPSSIPTSVQEPSSAPSSQPSLAPSPNTATGSQFSITLEFQDIADTSLFTTAAARWSEVIVGDLDDFTGVVPNTASTNDCSATGEWPTNVDDLYICARDETLPDNILGNAGPVWSRPDNSPSQTAGLPTHGRMNFDLTKIANRGSDLNAVILHEMGHVLGIAGLTGAGLITNAGTDQCEYSADTEASRRYQALSGCTGGIPLEQAFNQTQFTPGSDCVHWDENCFMTELMTPRVNAGAPFSELTVAGLQDIGYQVNFDAAEPFTADQLNTQCMAPECNSQPLHGGPIEPPSPQRLAAVEYGRQLLAEYADARPEMIESSGLVYMADKEVFILYEEKGAIHGVSVRP